MNDRGRDVPPLWAAKGHSATVYLFGDAVGTVNDEWFSDSVTDALGSSSEYWREFPDFGELSTSPRLAEVGLSGTGLSSRIGTTRDGRLRKTCARLGVDRASLESMRPWLAAQLLMQTHQSTVGIDPASGVESVLTATARQHGMSEHFEYPDAEAALGLFADMGDEIEIDYLMWSLDEVSQTRDDIDDRVQAWMTQDFAFVQRMSDDFRSSYPGLHERLATERNRRWVPRVAQMLEQSHHSFVLVGYGHLPTADGIVAQLEQSGFHPELIS